MRNRLQSAVPQNRDGKCVTLSLASLNKQRGIGKDLGFKDLKNNKSLNTG